MIVALCVSKDESSYLPKDATSDISIRVVSDEFEMQYPSLQEAMSDFGDFPTYHTVPQVSYLSIFTTNDIIVMTCPLKPFHMLLQDGVVDDSVPIVPASIVDSNSLRDNDNSVGDVRRSVANQPVLIIARDSPASTIIHQDEPICGVKAASPIEKVLPAIFFITRQTILTRRQLRCAVNCGLPVAWEKSAAKHKFVPPTSQREIAARNETRDQWFLQEMDNARKRGTSFVKLTSQQCISRRPALRNC
jgi:hypothetical protein